MLVPILRDHAEHARARLATCSEAEVASLEALLDRHVRSGAAAHPDLALDAGAFVRRLATHVEAEGPIVPDDLHADDFFLAAACLEGVEGAVTVLQRDFLSQIPLYLTRVTKSSDREKAEDIAQSIAERVVVSDGTHPPRLADYSGKGPLGGWLRVVSVRMGLNANRKKDGWVSESDAPEVPAGLDPELDHFKLRYKDEFKAAFEASFAALDDDQRLLLRLHSSGAHRGEDIAKIVGVDRSTAMRRLARAREVLFETTKATMTGKLGISPTEFESIARAVRSQIELTLSRVLAPRS
jgi:RNA polymerase sigma-70 factor (ECF subfamily)